MRAPVRCCSLAFSISLGCAGGGSDEDVTSVGGTMLPGTAGPSTGGDTESPPDSTGSPPDTTGLPDTTSATTPDDTTTGSTGSTTAESGDPGDWLLTVDRGSDPPRLVRIDLEGAALEICTLASTVDYASLTFARDGTLYGLNVAAGRIDVLNPCNCSFQLVGPTSLGPVALGLANTDEELLGVDPALDALVRIDLTTGLGTVVGPLTFMFGSAAMAWSDSLAQPYAIEAEFDYLYTIAPNTGVATPGPMLSLDLAAPGLAVHPNDGVLYACDGATFYTVDPATGQMTPVGGPLDLLGGCQTLAAPQTALGCIDSL